MIRCEKYAIDKEDFPVLNVVRVFRPYHPVDYGECKIFRYWRAIDQLIIIDKRRNTYSIYERPEI